LSNTFKDLFTLRNFC